MVQITGLFLYFGSIFGFLNTAIRWKTLASNDFFPTIQVGETYSKININNFCSTLECKEAVNRVLKNVDINADPCDDFYNYACGNFLKNATIPEDEILVSPYNDLKQLINDLHVTINEDILPNDLKSSRIVKTLYQSCMNTPVIENKGLQPLKAVLTLLKEWPIIFKDWKEENFDLIKTMIRIQDIGYSNNYLLRFSIKIDQKNSTRHIITLDSPAFVLPRENLVQLNNTQNSNIQAYFDYMVDMVKLIADNNLDDNYLRTELKSVLDFEIELAKISLSQEHRVNVTVLYNPITIAEMSKLNFYFPWLMYLNLMLDQYSQVDDNEIINVMDTHFFEHLGSLLNRTSKQTQANYLLWRIIFDSVKYLNDEARKKEFNFMSKVFGIKQREPRWKECTDVVSDHMDLASSAMYIKKYFQNETKDKITEMSYNIHEQLIKTIGKNNWIDERTRKFALKKLEAMNIVVGYPDELLDDHKLETHYKKLKDLKSEEYFQNILKLRVFRNNLFITKFKIQVDRKDWVTFGKVAVVNAHYLSNQNTIFVPAEIIRGVFFNKNRLDSLNYGAIGYVIGHEMTHAIDSEGRKYDNEGKLFNWWTNETENLFLEKAQCIKNKCYNFTDETTGLQLNGATLLPENIADISGIRHAFLAYIHKVPKSTKKQVSSFDLDAQKLFWISTANTWCMKIQKEILQNLIVAGVHGPPKYRINEPFSNVNEFSNTFNCPLGSRMNPIEKCSIW